MASNNLNKLILNVLRLTDYLSYLYNVRIPNNRSSSPYLRDLHKSIIAKAEKLIPELNNETNPLTDMQKVEKTINFLNQRCSFYRENNNKTLFWYSVLDDVDMDNNNPNTPSNGKKNILSILNNSKKFNFWSEEVGDLFLLLYKRVDKMPDNSNYTDELKNEINEIWNKAMKIYELKKQFLPSRPMAWRFVNNIYMEVPLNNENIHWGHFTYNNVFSGRNILAFTDKEQSIIRKYQNHWKELGENRFKFALELEFAYPSNKYDEICNECAEKGLFDFNRISLGTDCSLHPSSSYSSAEWTTAPMSYDEIHKTLTELGEVLRKYDCKFGSEINAGGHIHTDRFDTIQEIKLIKSIVDEKEKLPAFFGRGQYFYNEEAYRDGYNGELKIINYSALNNLIQEKYTPNMEIICADDLSIYSKMVFDETKTKEFWEQNIENKNLFLYTMEFEIKGQSKYISFNFDHKNTIEFRSFSSNSFPERNVEKLAIKLAEFIPLEQLFGENGKNKLEELKTHYDSYWQFIPEENRAVNDEIDEKLKEEAVLNSLREIGYSEENLRECSINQNATVDENIENFINQNINNTETEQNTQTDLEQNESDERSR